MTCKCDISKINLKDEKFELDIDLLKFQNLDVKTSFYGVGYEEKALNVGDNIYIWGGSNLKNFPGATRTKVLTALNKAKANISCSCVSSKLDLVKIVVGSSEDDWRFGESVILPAAHGFVARASPFIQINEEAFLRPDWLVHVLLHEFTHVTDPEIGCVACADSIKRLNFNRTRYQLFALYTLIHAYDIKNFHRQFVKSLVDNKQIFLKDVPEDLSDVISKDYLWHLKYASTSRYEFYAEIVPLFCDSYYRDNSMVLDALSLHFNNFLYPQTPSSDIWTLYIAAFNKKYSNFIEKCRNLHSSITDDCTKDYKHETFKPYIECSSIFGSFGCCESFKVSFSKYDTDCCKPSNGIIWESNNISVGDIILQNKCKCYYVFKPEIDIVHLISIIHNCRRVSPLAAFGTSYYDTNTENFKIFKEDIIQKIYRYLKNVIESNSDSKLFLNEAPCE
jgi:hypothetical protein